MGEYADFLQQPVAFDAETIGRLSKGETEIVRADDLVSRHELFDAIRHQLLRIEALASVMVEGISVTYADLALMESFSCASPLPAKTPRALYRRASKLNLPDPAGTVSALCYMGAIEWIAGNVAQGTTLDNASFREIFSRYNENEIERLRAIHAEERSAALDEDEPIAPTLDKIKRKKMDAYMEFLNSDLFMPSAQAELSHAMLQSIGLGQVRLDGYERAMSHAIFYRRGLLTRSVAPLAVGPVIDIEHHASSMYRNMEKVFKVAGKPAISQFDFGDVAFCTAASARMMKACTKSLEIIDRQWSSQLGVEGKRNTVRLLLRLFLKWGYLTIDFAAKEMGRSFSMTSSSMKKLVDAGVVKEMGHAQKSRLYCAYDVMALFETLLGRVSSCVATTRDEALAKIEQAGQPCP